MNQRAFLKSLAAGAATLSTAVRITPHAGEPAKALRASVGCFNRAWGKWSLAEALAGVKAAGYQSIGLISAHAGEAITSREATPGYLDALKQKVGTAGLTANITALRYRAEAAPDELIEDLRQQIQNAGRLGLKYAMTFGVDPSGAFATFYKVMALAAAEGAKAGVQIVLKPHGGVSATAADMLRCLDQVSHENFKIWYDAGNILHYTGRDPVAELKPLLKAVTGFCAKDCAGPRGEVMMSFGQGQVNFRAVFETLFEGGFKGPIMVEGVQAGATPAETTANAKANREYLEAILAQVGSR